jgi:hypothetical protein
MINESYRLCLCGCGVKLFPDERGRPRNWVRGHSCLGKKQPQHVIEKRAAGLRKAWTDPNKFKTMRKHSPELTAKRSAALRGIKRSVEFRAAASKRMTGTKHAPETITKLRVLYAGGILRKLSAESEAKRRKAISEQRKGCHNYGRAARDRKDHFNALHWIIRDPKGVTHEFDNLQSWCRANEWRFLPDAWPESKLPLWRRAVGGFNNQQRTDRKGQHHWRGWVLVSVLEQEEEGMPDMLARNEIVVEGGAK